MSDDILALIDNAVDDCLVSGDAMRWGPEGAVEELARRTLEPFAQALVDSATCLVMAVWADFGRLAEILRGCFKETAAILDETLAARVERKARMRHMHATYRRKKKGWR